MLLPILLRALVLGVLGEEYSYVVRGATLQCSQGTYPGVLNAMYSHGIYIKDKPVLNVADAIPGAHISKEYAFGLCERKYGLPCKPEIAFGTKWTHGKENVLIEGEHALLSKSTLICSCPGGGGIISILDDGQNS
ncbi:DUF4280 domain-containing protein [Paenibacillus durus]|uniref:DUF4280 domain-containing protein n=1 Tax=Paenibacillus durus TaxID=44251 RepID=UPI0009DF7C4F|nr:DUF4280 domain-containing protein [Paenibacillus durus]